MCRSRALSPSPSLPLALALDLALFLNIAQSFTMELQFVISARQRRSVILHKGQMNPAARHFASFFGRDAHVSETELDEEADIRRHRTCTQESVGTIADWRRRGRGGGRSGRRAKRPHGRIWIKRAPRWNGGPNKNCADLSVCQENKEAKALINSIIRTTTIYPEEIITRKHSEPKQTGNVRVVNVCRTTKQHFLFGGRS